MSAIPYAVAFPAMARKDSRPTTGTDQVNFRFPVSLIDRLEKFKDKHPLRPTVTNILIAAATEWLDRNEKPAPVEPRPPAPRKPPR